MSLFFNKKNLIRSAEKNIGENNFLKAEKILNKILSKDEIRDPYVLELMATVKKALGVTDEAYSFLREAAKLYEEENQIHLLVSAYKKILEIKPLDTNVVNSLADIFLSQKKEGDAFKVLMDSGDRALKEKKIDIAFITFKKALEIKPDSIDAMKKLLEIYKTKNEKEKIIEVSNKIGEILLKLGKLSESYLYFYDVISLEPSNYEANIKLVEVLIRLKSYKDAYNYLDSLINEIGIVDKKILDLKIEVLFNIGKIEELKATLVKYISENNGDYSILFELCNRYIEQGKYSDAVKLLEVLDLRKYDDFSKEINDTLEKILDLDPKNENALEMLIEFKRVVGDHYSLVELYKALYNRIIEKGDIKKAYEVANQWMHVDEDEWIRKEVRRLKLMLERSDGVFKDIAGKLEKTSLTDLLQMLENGKKTGVLKIYFADKVGRIYFKRGKIINSFFGNMNGKDAFIALMKLSQGDFIFQEEDVSSIEVGFKENSNMQLILESLRIIDEQAKKG